MSLPDAMAMSAIQSPAGAMYVFLKLFLFMPYFICLGQEEEAKPVTLYIKLQMMNMIME